MTDQNRINELAKVLETKKAFVRDGLDKGVKVEGDNVKVSQEDADAIRGAMADIEEIKMYIRAERADDDVAKFLESPQGESLAMQLNLNADQKKSWSTLGEAFVQSPEFKDFQKSGKMTMDQDFELKEADVTRYGTFERKDLHTRSIDAVSNIGFGRSQDDGVVPRLRRNLRVRDLFPAASTNANLIDFFRVEGFSTDDGASAEYGAVAAVAERTGTPPDDVFGIKPQSKLVFTPDQAPVRTLAHWEAAHRNVLADEPQLQSIINNELLYGLALYEDEQLINGTGVGENLRGILNTPGIQTYDPSDGPAEADDQMSDTLRRAATRVILANGSPTGYVMHPFDWEKVELQKPIDGDGHYMLVSNITIGAQSQVWRQPVVETVAMPEGTFVTGAWGLGAQLYDRERATVRIAEQHADFFVRNAVVILVESRLAFAVKRPQLFVKGLFAVPA